ncbi:permease [Iocasia frigidifontis]|uniref:Permease n=1 Tax=Iocasia fonsfrigidae TaxID=2682810 RepID=A0A8A7K8R6_9FIRM|nr:permease [Iocasia fonsfrigidae]QTL98193.1 permease [Iocasia fonsfrigidae]
MNKIIKKYVFFLIVVAINLLTMFFYPQVEKDTLIFTGENFINFLFMLTPIFICIGLLDVWVDRETMIKIMGEKSGLPGIFVAFLLGVATAVPLYALFPVAGMMLKKGSKITNVLIFICSCASIRIPLLLFEVSSMGWKFTIIRFIVNIFVVMIIAFIIEKVLTEKNKKSIYDKAKNM